MKIVRIASVDEKQFLICFKNKLWVTNNLSVEKWKVGDLLLFSVNKQITAIAEISGERFEDDKVIWDNGLFWNRVPLNFTHMLEGKDRIPIAENLRGILIKDWGTKYGWGILNKQPLEESTANYILNEIQKRPNALNSYLK